jgi:hypothetical protein
MDILIAAIIAACPGYDTVAGKITVTKCQEQMVNCVIGPNGVTTKELIESCTKKVQNVK